MSRESEIINIDTMIGRTLIDGKVVKNYARVIVGKTVDLVFP